MYRRARRFPTLLATLVLAFVGSAGGQETATDTVYNLHGTVVDGVTGQPLTRALVASGDRRLATLTDSKGQFSIEVRVPASNGGTPTAAFGGLMNGQFFGPLSILAQRPGYIDQQPKLLSLNDSLSSTDLVLKLMPAGVIAGQVSATATDSPHNVRILLLKRQVQDGERRWVQTGGQNTDAEGEFRFGHLDAGEYTVMTAEWAGDLPRRVARTAVTEEYPPVFLGDVPTLETAAKLQVRYGETSRAEIHLHPARYYPVTVPVTRTSPNMPVNVRVEAGAGNFGGYALGYNASDGAVEGSLPSGSYTLLISSFGQQPGFARLPIHVDDAPFRAAAVALAPPGSILVRVHGEMTGSSTAAPPTVQVMLRPEEQGVGFVNGMNRPGTGDEFSIENVQPGTYTVQANATRGYVAALSSGGVDLLQHPLMVSASGTADPIDATVRDDVATIAGEVTSDAGPLPQRSFIVLLPTDGSARFYTGFASPEGRFTVQNVAPGTYRMLATTEMPWQIPYRDPEAMRAYSDKGIAITVTSGQQLRMDAPLLESLAGAGQ